MRRNHESGHRQRMRDKYLDSGFNSFTMHDIVEMLLFYPIKRKDTKTMGYLAEDTFDGDLERFIYASPKELKSIDGIGDKAVEFISFFADIIENKFDSVENDIKCDPEQFKPELLRIKQLANDYYKDVCETRYDVMLIDNELNTVAVENTEIAFNETGNDEKKRIISTALAKNATSLLLLIYHSEGDYCPSEKELSFVKAFKRLCRISNMGLTDCIIVNQTGSLSLSSDYRYCSAVD